MTHLRHSLRLPEYDYGQPGGYFVTICIQDRRCLLGLIREGGMIPNDAGEMVSRWWTELHQKFPNIEIDQFVVMPNHFHGIIIIKDVPVEADLRVGPGADTQVRPYVDPGAEDALVHPHVGPGADTSVRPYVGSGGDTQISSCASPVADIHASAPLSTMLQWFKSMTTNAYIHGVKQFGWEPFQGKLWQRNYYDHILRDEKDLDRVRDYILLNPANWERDQEYNPHAG